MTKIAAERLEPVDLPEVEFAMADGIFIKQMAMDRAGIIVPQHAHSYDHVSMLAAGSVRLWRDGELVGDFIAPMPIHISAGTKHKFMSLEPGTVVYCIHRIDRTGQVEIAEEHQLDYAQLRVEG